MKAKQIVLVLLSIALVIVFLLSLRYCHNSKDAAIQNPRDCSENRADDFKSSLPSNTVAKFDAKQAFLQAFESPIELYGKVVDQHGDPVPSATVKLFPVDTPWEDSKSKMTLISDENGKFAVEGLKGTAMGVQATKDGYLYISPLGGPASSVSVNYGHGGGTGKRHSNPATPVILTLHKIGPVEPMFYMPDTRWKLPLDGTVRKISLDSKTGEGSRQIEFLFKSDWSKLPMDNEINSKQFDWSFEAKIPGGGFVWSDSDFNFDAPQTGYKESIRYHYSVDMPREKWKRFQHGRYFVKFADGSYGRIRIDIDGGSDRKPLKMTSWLCLKLGSRNLASPDKDSSWFSSDDPEK
jgi:Carboxypeptidase regulatory-like domain